MIGFYTNTPPRRTGWLAGTLQLIGWCLWHPTAWRSWVSATWPDLTSDFRLLRLQRQHWRDPLLRRLLVQLFGVLPLLLLLLTLPVWLVLGVPRLEVSTIAAGINVMAWLFGLLLASTIGVVAGAVAMLSMTLSLAAAFSVVVSMTTLDIPTALVDLILGLPRPYEPDIVVLLIGYSSGVALAGGIAAACVIPLCGTRSASISSRSIGGVGFALGVNSLIYAVTIGLLNNGMLTIGFSMLIVGLHGQPPHRRWWALVMAVALGGLYGLTNAAMRAETLPTLLNVLGATVTSGLWFACFFGLPYSLACWLAGPAPAALAASIGTGVVYIGGMQVVSGRIVPPEAMPPLILIGLAATLVGLAFHRWRPLLMFPWLNMWHLRLLRSDEQQPAAPHALRLHAAFWDEYQRLPWPALAEHVVQVYEQAPAEGQQALNYLVNSRQRAVVQQVRDELDLRLLERVDTLDRLATLPTQLQPTQASDATQALLRTLLRIAQDCAAARQHANLYHRRLMLREVEEHLDSLLRELERASTAHDPRFHAVVTRWSGLIAAEQQELASAAASEALIDSPYIVGVPLTAQQELFVGRHAISAQIEALITQQQRPPLLLYGQRRMGKTSLLNNLARLLPRRMIPCLVDLQGALAYASSPASFLHGLARALRTAAARQRQLTLPTLERAALADDPFLGFDEWLEAVEQQLDADAVLLLLLDEFEALDAAFERGALEPAAILGMLRHMIQHRPHWRLLLAGSHQLDEMRRWADYLINVQVVHIGLLSAAETRQLIEAPLPDFPLRYTPEASAAMQALTSGHPALIQLACAELVALKNQQPLPERLRATPADVAAIIAPALERGSFFFMDLEHNQLPAATVAALHTLALGGQSGPLDPHLAAPALRREVLEPCAAGYRFRVELVRHWFATRQPNTTPADPIQHA